MRDSENTINQGACLGAPIELFFPDFVDENGDDVFDDGTIWESYGDTSAFYEEGKKICNGHNGIPECPIKAECLAQAMANKERTGLWGGLIPIERRRIERRERRHRLQERRRREALGELVEDDEEDDQETNDDF